MLSIKPIAKAAVGATVRYFTDYVVSGGEPGVWHGEGAEALGLTGKEVRAEELENLLYGYSPDGKRPLVQHQSGRRLHRPGNDFCCSLSKSASTLLAVGEPEVQLAIRESHREGVKRMLEYLQDEAAVGRSGKGGCTKERGGLIVAAFEHLTSRPVGDATPDPQLHTHCVIANVVTRSGGRTGTLVSPILFRHKMTAGAIYRAELAYQLERRLGVVLERDGPSFKVAGVPGELVKEFSKRREGIEAELLRTGRSGAIASARATAETRAEKKHVPIDDLLADWRKTARRFGFGPERVNDLLMRQPPRQDVAERVSAAIRTGIERVTREHSHFSERELLRFAAEEGQARGLPAFLLRHAVRQELARGPEIIALGRHRGEPRYTTREMMAMEAELLRSADAMNGAAPRPLSGKSVERMIERHGLSGEKRDALHHLAKGSEIAVVSGMAGTGKTTLLRAFNEVCVAEGYTVFGMAVSGKAARELEERADIRSVTVARFLYDQGKDVTDTLKHHARMLGRAALGKSTWKEERIRLDAKTVLVCDEASMLGTRAMRDILAAAQAAGARVVFVGDERQIQPIESGAPFRAIAQRVGEARLTEITRQKDPRDRENVRRIATGRAREALEDYAARGLLHVAADRRQAAEQLIAEWKARGVARPEDNLILAATNHEVGVLNRMAQEERRRSGELGGFRATVASKQLFLGTPAIRLGEDWLYEGDRCLFTKNARSLGVNNGHLATVVRIDQIRNSLTARLDGGRIVTVPLGYFGAEYIRLGYAVTSFKAQGATVLNSYVLFGGALQHRELSYVQASRASGETRLFTDRLDAGEGLGELSRQVAQSRAKTLAREVLERNKSRGLSPELGW
jgi:conjugative relaxase-like TrwC/TraI family protein